MVVGGGGSTEIPDPARLIGCVHGVKLLTNILAGYFGGEEYLSIGRIYLYSRRF